MLSGGSLPTDAITYGPDVGTEEEFHLVGDVKGKRVLELGCGEGRRSIAFARRGATAIGIDLSAEMIESAKRLCEREGVRVELRQGDLADLAFLRADSVDLVFSAYALISVPNVERAFRQANRVLKPGGPLVFSLPHPAYHVVDDSEPEEPPRLVRSYFDRSPRGQDLHGVPVQAHHRTVSDLVAALVRSGFRIDTMLEPEPSARVPSSPYRHEALDYLPRALIMRARKEGN